MSLENEVQAIRLSVALLEDKQRIYLRLAGSAASDLLNRICPCELFIRDGQMQHTLLLNENGNPILDLFVCADGDDFLLLGDGMSSTALISLLKEKIESEEEIQISDLTIDHGLISITGPYAWELLSEVISTEIIGLPFLGFFHGDDFTCFRSTSTGEFTYDLLLPNTQLANWRDRILKLGKNFGLEIIGQKALDLCALENFIFNIRQDVIGDISPLELQLQWRISYKKTYPGSEAMQKRRNQSKRLAVLVLSKLEWQVGDIAWLENQEVGAVLNAQYSFDRKAWIGLTLIDRKWAYTGVEIEFRSKNGVSSQGQIHSAPVINNRSLFVDPQRHTYATRAEKPFPSLIHWLPQ